MNYSFKIGSLHKLYFLMCYSLKRILALSLASVFLVAGCSSWGSQKPQQSGPEVKVMMIRSEHVVLTTELPGRTVASQVSEIRPQVSGLIIKRAFKEGSYVNSGDLLYQIDPAQYKAAYDQAKAAVAMAEANLPAARSREERYRKLIAVHAIGQQDYDDVLAAMLQAEAQLESSKAALEMASIKLSYTPIKSPISGRIGRSNVTEGAMVTEYQPTSLATVQQLDPIYVDVPQSTVELLRLQKRIGEGKLKSDSAVLNKVKIILEDGSNYPLEGTLEFHEVTVSPSTGSVILRITVPNPDSLLLPGMFVRVLLNEGTIERGLLVPQSAVSRDQKGQPFVWMVDKEGKASLQMITIDRAIEDKWIITSGLTAGDQVIIEGMQRVSQGVPVTISSQETTKTH